jgi:hypothetical protein
LPSALSGQKSLVWKERRVVYNRRLHEFSWLLRSQRAIYGRARLDLFFLELLLLADTVLINSDVSLRQSIFLVRRHDIIENIIYGII